MWGLGDSNVVVALVSLEGCPKDMTKLATPYEGHRCATLSETTNLKRVLTCTDDMELGVDIIFIHFYQECFYQKKSFIEHAFCEIETELR